MLSDSKIREAGFIRNSSSRKILYQPEPQKRNQQSDDSFSSFEYETSEKGCGKEKSYSKNDTSIVKREQREKQQKSYESITKQSVKQIPYQVPPQIPKPTKKQSNLQPSFQNQRLKNNFFNQPSQPPTNEPPHQLSRNNTPYFMQNTMKQDLQQVNNICNRIGNMKLEGNFSFNPKVNNRFGKGKLGLESGNDEDEKGENHGMNVRKNSSLGKVGSNNKAQEAMVRKPKQNNYFSNTNNNSGNRFQYDFESSSSDNNEAEKSQQSQSQQSEQQNQQIENERDNQVLRYYQEQQRQRTQPQIKTRTKPKVTSSHNNTYGRISNHYQNHNMPCQQPHQKPSNHSRHLQNQQSSSNHQQQQQLITQYNKDDFSTKIPTYMRNKHHHLAQNNRYQNTIRSQQPGVIATNGGVCFSVDVKQFSQNASTVVGDSNNYRQTKRGYNNLNQKKKKTNEREEILKRREMAKVYSKQARFRLFGFA